LSNALVLGPQTTFGELMEAINSALNERRDADLVVLTTILAELNGNDSLGKCGG
jgi:hypothetical protein